jgi:uncharacterized protein
MASADDGARGVLQVEVAYSPRPREVDRVCLHLPEGSTVADALRRSGLLEKHGLLLDDALDVGVWMKRKPLDTPLRVNDRVEIYRPLQVDPKEARRQRYKGQAAKKSAAVNNPGEGR